jgi:SAM-dependent methyltransferase
MRNRFASILRYYEEDQMKLDIGCGQNPYVDPQTNERFTGIDIYDGADIVHDLTKFPWPIKSNSVDEAWCSHVFEHIPGKLRGKFMDEVYRILKPGAKVTVIVPAYNSARAVQDFTHEWPPVAPESFFYFQKPFRDGNRLTHGLYDLKCDFEMVITGTIGDPWVQKSQETQMFAGRHYMNVTQDLVATMTKKVAEQPADIEAARSQPTKRRKRK